MKDVDFNKFCFVVEEKTNKFGKRKAYRYLPLKECFVMVSPNYKEESLYVSCDEIMTMIRKGKMTPYTNSNKVHNLINRMWENYTEGWVYEGKRYEVCLSKTMNDAPWHNVGKYDLYKIGYHHGTLVWVGGFCYSPTVYYSKFFGIDKAPEWEGHGWTRINNIHPVYCYEDNSLI